MQSHILLLPNGVAVRTWTVAFVYIIACVNQGVRVNSQFRQASSKLGPFPQSLGLEVRLLDISVRLPFWSDSLLQTQNTPEGRHGVDCDSNLGYSHNSC